MSYIIIVYYHVVYNIVAITKSGELCFFFFVEVKLNLLIRYESVFC